MPLQLIAPSAWLNRVHGDGRFFPTWLTRAVGDMLEPSIYRFILRYSLPEQIYLVVVTLLSFAFLYASLDLPNQIVN